MSYEQII
jgi:enoyl-CoA hydratase/carnithine racemase